MINEKISLRTWIEDAADQGVPLHTYLLKLSSEELELSEDAILEQMQTMLQVMEESAAFRSDRGKFTQRPDWWCC